MDATNPLEAIRDTRKLSAFVTLRFAPAELEQITALADKFNTARATLIRAALRHGLNAMVQGQEAR